METNTETQEAMVAKSIRFEPVLHDAITKLAEQEHRPSFNNMVEHLLKTHPRVKRMLTAETAEAAA